MKAEHKTLLIFIDIATMVGYDYIPIHMLFIEDVAI